MSAELRLGRWQDSLSDVECDAFISDPPYSERTHSGQKHGRHDGAMGSQRIAEVGLGYDHLTPDDVFALVDHWSIRTRGWFCALTSHDLIEAYSDALNESGRYVFAPLACVQTGSGVRLAGDGPSNWTCHLVVARPRANTTFTKWGALPGAYVGVPDGRASGGNIVAGQKPLWLMRAIIRDYSRPGDLVCDPYAGGGTTLYAALSEGRRAIGSEMNPATHALAIQRLRSWQAPLFIDEVKARPQDLFGGEP